MQTSVDFGSCAEPDHQEIDAKLLKARVCILSTQLSNCEKFCHTLIAWCSA